MANYRQQSQWTAEQALAYITGLEAVDEESQYEAFATAYNYFMNLSKKKISWSVHLQKLAYEFIDLAFNNNKHSSIKDVLKAYRALTQGQYPQSLRDVLEHYRDRKLQAILQQDILHQNIDIIVRLSNIQNQQASSTMIFSSFKPDQKKKLQQLKHKLKIVWQGYKYIIQTVRINQKLEDVFKVTLNKVFTFVDKYNRKHEFKSFCRTLRAGLNTAFNKRQRTEQQKAIYIDIQKSDVNDRNIQIRLEQFKVTIKLGLWQEAFQVLEDINNLMKVRKGTVKGNIMHKYYDNLSLLFRKSNYWHYHAFAYYNYFLYAQKNPKLSNNERIQLSDKLLLSVLCIPPVTLQSNQSKQGQQKISSMMISSTKIPSKQELFDIIVSGGIAQKASTEIKKLWSFMFLQFDLDSLQEGLEILNKISNQTYGQFKTLIQDILIYKQLQSISQIYQRIKIQSLLSLIPLPRQRIQKILLSSYHQKILDFFLDQDQKIIIFQDKSIQSLSNPTQNFLSIYLDLAIQKQKQRQQDSKHIINKFQNFIQSSEEYYWKIRQFKIDQYRKKLKKPKQELLNQAHKRKLQQKQQKQRLQAEKLARQEQALRLAEQKKKQFGTKKIIINDIIQIKQNRVVRILSKKIEQLTDEQIQNITIDTLNTHLQQIKTKIQNNRQARFKKAFNQIDYIERERRQRLQNKIKQIIPKEEQQKKQFEQIKKESKLHYEQINTLQNKISKLMPYLKPKIQDQTKKLQEKYQKQMTDYKQRLVEFYKQKIIIRAKALAEQNRKKKQNEDKMMRQAQSSYSSQWTFKGVSRISTTQAIPQPTTASSGFGGITIGKKTDQSQSSTQQYSKSFAPLAFGKKRDQDRKEQPSSNYSNYNNTSQKWNMGKKQQTNTNNKQEDKPRQQTASQAFVPPPTTGEKKTFGMGMGLGQQPKRQQYKKDDKPRGPPKKYVNVNN